MLTILSELPNGFLDCAAEDLYQIFGGPTLIHLSGKQARPLFVSILLHGNEISGLLAVQEVLSGYQGSELPRACSLFVGNVCAAQAGVRYLPGQHDFNRIWFDGRDEEHLMTQQVIEEMRKRDVFAAIDIHNNTSRNPIYSIVAKRDPQHLQLARSFRKVVVYSHYPRTTNTVAFAELCPAITIEAGLPGEGEGIARTVEFLHACLKAGEIPLIPPQDVDLFQSVAVIKMRRSCSCGLLGEDVDVQLFPGIDRYNFTELEAGTVLARVSESGEACLDIRPTNESKRNTDFIKVESGQLVVKRPVMPAMLTTDANMIRLDCLCYLMERLS